MLMLPFLDKSVRVDGTAIRDLHPYLSFSVSSELYVVFLQQRAGAVGGRSFFGPLISATSVVSSLSSGPRFLTGPLVFHFLRVRRFRKKPKKFGHSSFHYIKINDKYNMKTQKSAKQALMETKKKTFLDSPEWSMIVQNIKNTMISDGSMSTLLDYERVLDEADIYAFKNWHLGELVDGPVISRYSVTATFMWPHGLMPDPRGAKRLLPLGCTVKFKKTTIKVPVQIKSPSDYKAGTHYPKLIERSVWLVNITMPKALMNDIREGSIDIADQTIDLEDLDDAYAKDYDTESMKDKDGQNDGGMGGGLGDLGMGLGGPPGGGLGGPPGGPPGMGL